VLRLSYDIRADMLYISTGDRPFERASMGAGIIWRYAAGGDLIGATILDFYDQWFGDPSELTNQLAYRFHLSEAQVKGMVDRAVRRRE
jgi:Protein of unknown function (DUF2283)